MTDYETMMIINDTLKGLRRDLQELNQMAKELPEITKELKRIANLVDVQEKLSEALEPQAPIQDESRD